MNSYDVVVIGAGAAGLNAALVLTRARRSVAIVDAGAPRNAAAANLHGFLSRDGMPPLELLAAGRREVAGYGGTFISSTVTGISPGFVVALADGTHLKARRILVATGLRDVLPPIPGMQELWGTDVVVCPYCHGYEVADRPIGVMGPPEKALLVRQWSSDVVYFAPTSDFPELAARDIRIVEGTVARLVIEDSRLRAVEMTDGRRIAREALFAMPTFEPRDSFLESLGYAAAETSPFGQTNIPGLWVAGNVSNPMATLIQAAAEGVAAAAAINSDLVRADTDAAVARGFSHEIERQVSDLRPKSVLS
ncbi:thioredoxin reductase [Kibdelosporangium banguiense]|uniref:Thioredoxin reductase n=1 Tax=Kibdelosporangium banguiense TaxID=1365924 RepID=A0ABS4TNG3_9PSEU|nr:NAD(P)/FAD-dependent oxidoreductase [Kibdelosporangium banguiense]MBP2325505.1 thioredoxin reductase [Kibdelosporangium banguiense]